jgi:hypothetical protein
VIRAERNFHATNLLPEVRGHCRGQPAFVIPSGSLALSEAEWVRNLSFSVCHGHALIGSRKNKQLEMSRLRST